MVSDIREYAGVSPLSAVYPLISSHHKFENVLDSGSQINGIREDIWEAIGDPLLDAMMTMQSADNAQNDTLRKLRNVRFTFGDVDLYMQMQVVENAPYKVLLGKPFFALTACSTKHFPNGDEHITITNPNTGRSATILAVEHSVKNRRKLSDTGKLGWRSTARKYQHATFVPDHDTSQLYVKIIPTIEAKSAT